MEIITSSITNNENVSPYSDLNNPTCPGYSCAFTPCPTACHCNAVNITWCIDCSPHVINVLGWIPIIGAFC